jgi:dynein heavy chain 1
MVGCLGMYLLLRVDRALTVQPRKIRQELDAILASTREMPSRMRQYAAFEFVQDNLKSLLKANVLVGELKSEALRERHWSRLYKALKMPSGYQSSR